MYELRKVVKTKDMPENVFDSLYEFGNIVEDGFGAWTVGEMLAEASENPEGFGDTSDIKAVDEWMIQQGVLTGETVLLQH